MTDSEREDPRLKGLADLDLADLADFDSVEFDEESTFTDDGRNEHVAGMWDRYGFRDVGDLEGRDKSEAIASALLLAHEMCQSFVDTFSTETIRYRVTFDPNVGVAGTDLDGKVIGISPSPIYDETLTPQQAGVILTGMAAHEVSHVRYGRATASAVRRVFGNKRAPNAISNLLDDMRIERRFAEDYPGYRDVFEPLRRYVASRSDVKGQVPNMGSLVNLCARALKFWDVTPWPTLELRAERDWWRTWSDRWSREDSPRRHVEGVREALRHIVVTQQAIRLKKEAEAQKAREEAAKRMREMPEDLSRLRGRLGDLPPIAQKAIRLVGEGRSGVEVAATLGVDVPQARAIVRSARRHLAGDLGQRRRVQITIRTAEDLDRALAAAKGGLA